MKLRNISERISYLPATNDPLSADVSIIHGDKADWIFDVGNCENALNLINGIKREKNIVLSHFHEDHTGNLRKVSYSRIFCGDYTKKKFKDSTEIIEPTTFDDGVKLTLFPLPSLHSKGAVGLEVDDEYAFFGDSTYGSPKNGQIIYNLNFLQEMIETLEKIHAKKVMLSHDPDFCKDKDKVIEGLKEFYNTRTPGEAFLVLKD